MCLQQQRCELMQANADWPAVPLCNPWPAPSAANPQFQLCKPACCHCRCFVVLLQMERRALERMVKSLQGGTTFYGRSSQQAAPGAAVAVAMEASDDASSVSRGRTGGKGKKQQASGKQAKIMDANRDRLLQQQQAAEQAKYEGGPGKLAAAALKAAASVTSSSRAKLPELAAAAGSCSTAAEKAEEFRRNLPESLRGSSLAATCCVAWVALLHAQLLCLCKVSALAGTAAALEAQPSQAVLPRHVAAVPFSSDSALKASPGLAAVLQQLLLAVMVIAALPAELLHTCVQLPQHALTLSSKPTHAAPVQAAAAVLAAVGYDSVAAVLLQSSGFNPLLNSGSAGKQGGASSSTTTSSSQSKKREMPFQFVPTGLQAAEATSSSTQDGDTGSKAGGSSTLRLLLPSWQRLQLLVLAHDLRRDAAGGRDCRISGFVPDAWQRQLLDIVDAGEQSYCAQISTNDTNTFCKLSSRD